MSRIALSVALMLAGAASLRASTAASACLGAELVGSRGPDVFADGFETGDTSRWLEPAVPEFSIRGNVDLGVEIELDAQTTGEHLLELRWLLPGGELYQSVALPISNGEETKAKRRVAGYPFPVAVAPIRPLPVERASAAGSGAVATSLPVAGTSIEDSALWGQWSLEIYFDGGEEACLPPVTFRLEP